MKQVNYVHVVENSFNPLLSYLMDVAIEREDDDLIIMLLAVDMFYADIHYNFGIYNFSLTECSINSNNK